MGVTTQPSYGLEPFVFDKGEVKSQAQLVQEAQRKIKGDKVLKQTLKKHKGEVVKILQDCLDKVNDQLEKGEDICRKAHFPLQHPFNFEDLESLAQHDFTIDIHADVLDKLIKDLFGGFLDIVWSNVAVEDVPKARMLERYNEALQERMETLEYHLIDRSRQLSNCRYAYFLEIQHLRNQVYIKHAEGENFEPVEAYFFDPTEFLEEELRLQLNDKITLSVKGYHEKLQEAQRLIEDLEMQLEAAGGAFRKERKHRDKLGLAVEKLVVENKPKRILDEMLKQEEREVTAWAMDWAEKNGYIEDKGYGSLEADLQQAREEGRQLQQDLARLREEMESSQQELDDERLLKTQLQDEFQKLKELHHEEAKANSLHARQQSNPQGSLDEEELEALRAQIEHLKLDAENALQRALSADQELAAQAEAAESSRRALEQLQLQHEQLADKRRFSKKAESETASSHHGSMLITAPGRQVSERRMSSHGAVKGGGDGTGFDAEHAADYEAAKGALEDMYNQYQHSRQANAASRFGRLASIAGIGICASQGELVQDDRRDQLDGALEDVDLEDDLVEIDVEGSPGALEYVTWLKALLNKKGALLRGVEGATLKLHDEAMRHAAEAEQQRCRANEAEAEASRLVAAVGAVEAAAAEARAAAVAAARNGTGTCSRTSFGGTADRVPVRDGFFECDTQTNITGATDAGFYLLEVPPCDDQLLMEMELEDLNACAVSSYESTIAQVRSCQRPPLGYGSGYCPRSAFIRLFQGTTQRITRMDELLHMIEKLKRAELLRVMHGVHLLMESTLPNDDGRLRDAIFGRGITESALVTAKTGTDLLHLSQKWRSQVSRITNILLKREYDIELGVHLDRRTFMVGGAAGGGAMAGGAGGGLAARERRDFSPTRGPVWQGVSEQEDEVQELQSLHTAVYLSPRSRAREAGDLSLEGKEIPLYNLDGSCYSVQGFDNPNGPYIVVGGRYVPRGSVEMMPQHGYLAPSLQEGLVLSANSQTMESPRNLSVKASTWRPGATECPAQQRGHIHHSPPSFAGEPRDDENSFRNDLLLSSWGLGTSGTTVTGTTVVSVGGTHCSEAGLSAENELPPSHATADCKAITSFGSCDDEGLDDAATKVIARLRPARGAPAAVNVVQPTFDVEEPQAEPAPGIHPRPQSGLAGRALRSCDRRDREVERARRQMCDASAGTCGPMPSWVMDQLEEQKAPRNAGCRHTNPKRVASAGRLRGAFTEASVTPANAVAGVLSGMLAEKGTGLRPATASGSRQLVPASRCASAGLLSSTLAQKTSGVRPGTAPGSRGARSAARPSSSPMVRTVADAGAASKPLVRIMSMPVVKALGAALADAQREAR